MTDTVDELAARRAKTHNLVTPEEAATRQCRRVGLVSQPNPFQVAAWAFPACAGPACMHWRWGPVRTDPGSSTEPPKRGFCGIGGAP